jgi:hypothetical protein
VYWELLDVDSTPRLKLAKIKEARRARRANTHGARIGGM